MVLGVFAVGRAHQATDWKIKAGRTILPLVIPVGNERSDAMGNLLMMEHMRDDAVDCGVAAAALLVGHAASITEAGEHQAVGNALELVLVVGQPSQRADRAGNEQKAIAITR